MTTETRLTRTVIDGGIEFEISVPDTWLEVPVVGSVLALAGRTEEDDETLNPSLLVMVDELNEGTVAYVDEFARTMSASYPQWRGRWGASCRSTPPSPTRTSTPTCGAAPSTASGTRSRASS